MKAVICTKYGAPEVLKIEEIEKPTPKDNEILIKIAATTVSVADCRVRGFRVPPSFWIPARIAIGFLKPRKAILGMELSGEVEDIGANVTLFKKGDKIFTATGHTTFGGYAEYKCMPEKNAIVIKPNNLSLEESAAIPLGGLTALYFLKKANIKQGQKVLIYGASGSVGTYALQLAKYFGAEVTAVCSTDNVEMAKSIGADKVIDYKKEDFTKNVKTYDVIMDAVGKSPYSGSIKSLNKKGTYLHVVATPALSLKMFFTSLITGKKLLGGDANNNVEDLKFLKELVESSQLKPVIDKIYPLEQIVEAHKYVDKGYKKGNVVIKVQ